MAYVGQSPDAHFSATAVKDSFDGDGSTTSFTLTNGGSTNTVDVFVENVRQEPTEAYSVDGTTLTFTEAPPAGTGNIYVVNKSPVRLQATHPAGLALEAHSATISTDLTVDGGVVDINGNELILDADGDTSITSDTDDVIDFRTAGSDRWQILANGNLKAATDGLGIDFSASEGSGASASVLDDYEVGSWTPTYYGGTTAGTTTYSFRNGAYTKIGNLVHATAIIGVSSATGTGVALIGGLPFTSLSQGNGVYPPLNWAYNNGHSFTSGYQLAGYVRRNETSISLTQFNSSGTVSGVSVDSSFTEIDFSVTYHTA